MRSRYWLTLSLLLTTLSGLGVAHAKGQPTPLIVIVGQGPFAMAVDERVSRVFVACAFVPEAGGLDARVSVLDSGTGAVVRTLMLRTAPTAIAVDKRTSRVFVVVKGPLGRNGPSNGSVWVLDAATGATLRTVTVGQDPVAVAVDELTGHAFVVNRGAVGRDGSPTGHGTVSMLDTATGVVLHTSDVAAGPQAAAIAPHSAHAFILNSFGHSISMLDTRSGRLLQTISMGTRAFPIAMTVDDQGARALVVDGAGTVSVLDTGTGAVLHKVGIGPFTYLPPAVAVDTLTGRAFVVNHSASTVRMLDAATGAVRRTLSLGTGPIALAVNQQTGKAFVVSRGAPLGYRAVAGMVTILDGASGRILRTVPVGLGPTAIGLDTQRGRAFVANTDGGTVSIVDVSY